MHDAAQSALDERPSATPGQDASVGRLHDRSGFGGKAGVEHRHIDEPVAERRGGPCPVQQRGKGDPDWNGSLRGRVEPRELGAGVEPGDPPGPRTHPPQDAGGCRLEPAARPVIQHAHGDCATHQGRRGDHRPRRGDSFDRGRHGAPDWRVVTTWGFGVGDGCTAATWGVGRTVATLAAGVACTATTVGAAVCPALSFTTVAA